MGIWNKIQEKVTACWKRLKAPRLVNPQRGSMAAPFLAVGVAGVIVAVGGATMSQLVSVARDSTSVGKARIDITQTAQLLARNTATARFDDGSGGEITIKVARTPEAWPGQPLGEPKNENGCTKVPTGAQSDPWGNPYCLIAFYPVVEPGSPGSANKTTTLSSSQFYSKTIVDGNARIETIKDTISGRIALFVASAGPDGIYEVGKEDIDDTDVENSQGLGPTGDDIYTLVTYSQLDTSNRSGGSETATGLTECTGNELLTYRFDATEDSFYWECVAIDEAVYLGTSSTNKIPTCGDKEVLTYMGTTNGWTCVSNKIDAEFGENIEDCQDGEGLIRIGDLWMCEDPAGLPRDCANGEYPVYFNGEWTCSNQGILPAADSTECVQVFRKGNSLGFTMNPREYDINDIAELGALAGETYLNGTGAAGKQGFKARSTWSVVSCSAYQRNGAVGQVNAQNGCFSEETGNNIFVTGTVCRRAASFTATPTVPCMGGNVLQWDGTQFICGNGQGGGGDTGLTCGPNTIEKDGVCVACASSGSQYEFVEHEEDIGRGISTAASCPSGTTLEEATCQGVVTTFVENIYGDNVMGQAGSRITLTPPDSVSKVEEYFSHVAAPYYELYINDDNPNQAVCKNFSRWGINAFMTLRCKVDGGSSSTTTEPELPCTPPVTCGEGTVEEDGVCVASASGGQYEYVDHEENISSGTSAAASCPSGTTLEEATCQGVVTTIAQTVTGNLAGQAGPRITLTPSDSVSQVSTEGSIVNYELYITDDNPNQALCKNYSTYQPRTRHARRTGMAIDAFMRLKCKIDGGS